MAKGKLHGLLSTVEVYVLVGPVDNNPELGESQEKP